MHALSLYLDTSVIGGYFDFEFMADTRALWELRAAGRFKFVSSELVIAEIAGAPERVRELLRLSVAAEDVFEVSEEMEELAAAYMAQKSCRRRLPTTHSMSRCAPWRGWITLSAGISSTSPTCGANRGSTP